MFGVTGGGLAVIKTYQNGGKKLRRSLDQWDRVWISLKSFRHTLTVFTAKYIPTPQGPLNRLDDDGANALFLQ